MYMTSVAALPTCRQWSGASPLLRASSLASMSMPRHGPRAAAGSGKGLARVWRGTAGVCLQQWLLQHRHGGGVGLGEDADLWEGGWAGEPVREGERYGVEGVIGVMGRGGGLVGGRRRRAGGEAWGGGGHD